MREIGDITHAIEKTRGDDHSHYLTSLDGSVRCMCGVEAPYGADAIKWHHAHTDEVEATPSPRRLPGEALFSALKENA